MSLSLRRLPLRSLGLLLAAGVVTIPGAASATDPVLRHQEDLHGDVVVFGSTLGFDCGAGLPAPPGSVASCLGQTNTSDTAPDLYWRDDVANASITSSQARTSATLVLPPGSIVTYARLYWAALKDGAAPDTDAILDWLGGPQQTINADQTWVVPYGLPAHPTWYYYQASGDATDFVSTWGAGDFRVSGVTGLPLANTAYDIDRAFSAWTLVVFYENPGDELRNLALFDSFTPIDPGMPGQGSAQVTLSGFLVPQGFSAKMTAIAYEGDAMYTGDHFTLNGQKLSDGKNPAENFFNSSRSELGVPVSGFWDVPQLSGEPGSMAGYDLDTADVTSHLAPGATSCVVGADSTLDIFFLGGFVTSVASKAPDFKVMSKTAVDVNGGAVLPGDTIEYTITATNNGNDASTATVITDALQPGIALVNGSIEILQSAGGPVGVKSNNLADDEGEYNAGTKTVTWRVGSGANNAQGGNVAPGQTVKVRFKATVTAQSGSVVNQAILTGSGLSGAPQKQWLSDGDPNQVGAQATPITINECNTDADCDGNEPHCVLATHTCSGCTSDADCKDPALPACQPSGACGECSMSNDTLCTGNKPVCNTMLGICVLCTLGPMGDASQCTNAPEGPLCVAGMGKEVHCGCLMDSDCGGPMSGKVCDSVPQECIDGCRGMGGNGCMIGFKCTSTDSTIGTCVPVPADDGGPGSGGAGGTGGAGGNVSNGGAGGKGGDDSGSGGGAADPGDTGGCACSVPGEARWGDAAGGVAGLAAVIGMAMRRRRRTAR